MNQTQFHPQKVISLMEETDRDTNNYNTRQNVIGILRQAKTKCCGSTDETDSATETLLCQQRSV